MGNQLVRGRATSLDPSEAPPPAELAHASYYGVFYEDAKVGFAESSRVAQPDGGARFIDRAYWKFKTQGAVQSLAVETDAVADAHWKLRTFKMRVDAGPALLSASGEVTGDALDVELVTAGRTVRDTIQLDAPLLLPGMARAYVAARNPVAGSTYVMDIYNPVVRSTEKLEVVVEGRDEFGWRLKEILRGSLSTTAWIDDDGNTVRELSPMGFEMRAMPRAEAVQMPDDNVPDLVFAVSVPVRGRIPEPSTLKELKLRFGGVDLERFEDLSGGRQFRYRDEVTIQVDPYPARGTYTLPYEGPEDPESSTPPDGWKEALASEPLIQSDDPAIVSEARRILGKERDPARAARKLSEWVHTHLAKENSVGVPSALEVLNNMSGDCNEHTVLFTALARSQGLPTRMAAGVVYTHARGGGTGLYYHAWPEVWVGDRWVAVDPTLGQVPADATHVRFVTGSLNEQVDILSLIGTLRAEVVSVSQQEPARAQSQESP